MIGHWVPCARLVRSDHIPLFAVVVVMVEVDTAGEVMADTGVVDMHTHQVSMVV